MIAYAKDNQKNIIFVSDDAKEDWILEINGQKKGLRSDLRKDFRDKSGEIILHYNFKRFLEWAKSSKEAKVSDKTFLNVEKPADLTASEPTDIEVLQEDFRAARRVSALRDFIDASNSSAVVQSDIMKLSALASAVDKPWLSVTGQSEFLKLSALARAIDKPWLSAVGQTDLAKLSALSSAIDKPWLSAAGQTDLAKLSALASAIDKPWLSTAGQTDLARLSALSVAMDKPWLSTSDQKDTTMSPPTDGVEKLTQSGKK